VRRDAAFCTRYAAATMAFLELFFVGPKRRLEFFSVEKKKGKKGQV
jgi:hypothetical protein